ncbi:MAG: prenyltransferase/squalene oxidase repeat-containing protein, partial [Planctomycetota bacterium]
MGELEKALAGLKERLIALRGRSGVWEGRLSSSALSTAVACFALRVFDSKKYASLIDKGIEWIVAN